MSAAYEAKKALLRDIPAKCGLKPGDIVKTPLGKRAKLTTFVDGRWNAQYLGEPAHLGGVVLDPRRIFLVDEE